ncbi:MAG: RDD family protein [Planctomycetota bacterium]
MKLDTLEPVSTPEGAVVALRVAGPVPRALAWGLDLVIRVVGYVAVGIAFGFFGEVGGAAILLVMFAGEWWYGVLFEVLGKGATPGKRMMKLRVVHADGTPVEWGASIIRNFLLAADFLPPPFGAGLLAMLLSKKFQRLGDLAAGTLVVHVDRTRVNVRETGAPPFAPPVTLRPVEQLALVEFAHRTDSWTHARRIELTDLLEPLTSAKGTEGVERVLGMARWVEGRG